MSKMERMGLDESEKQSIINTLIEEKFLDESRYAGAFVRDKSRLAGWGIIKIRYALRARKIPDDVISSALGEITRDAEAERLRKLLAVKAKSFKSDDLTANKLNKLIRFAVSRGFDYELSLKVAKEIIG
jgi:regulatory protein